MSKLHSIFERAKNPFKNKSYSQKAYEDLDQGKKILVTMNSDRYTYGNEYDNKYDKDWKPSTPEEISSGSPKGYFSTKEEEEKVKEELGITPENEELYQKKQISIPSTALRAIEYDPDTELLRVNFTSGSTVYDYPAVPLETVQALLKASSKGSYFMNNIHDQYSLYRKNHKPKTAKDRKAVRKYIKKYTQANKGRWKNK